ncbi:MAG: hypothetical protein D6725_15685 [Planctomycetota bacterium]|nr:MAG: hypothetical protein D6725_15685 [Planctomycetota bacterium]
MQRYVWWGLVVAVALTAPRSALAVIDEVTVRGAEKTVKGEVTKVTATEITVKPTVGAAQTISADDVLDVRWGDEPVKLRLARVNEHNGNLTKALQAYQEALAETKTQREFVKRDIEFLVARALAKQALADPTKLDQAIDKLTAFVRVAGDHFRYYQAVRLLGDAYLAKGEFDKAQQQFDTLAKAPWSAAKKLAQIRRARILLARGDTAGALQAFEQVISEPAASPADKERRQEALLGKATVLVKNKQYDEALKTIAIILKETPPENSAIQAEAYLRKGDCLEAQGRIKEAILAYLHVPVLFAHEKAAHAEALYHLARLWAAYDRPDRAEEARSELLSNYPNSPWARKLQGGS